MLLQYGTKEAVKTCEYGAYNKISFRNGKVM